MPGPFRSILTFVAVLTTSFALCQIPTESIQQKPFVPNNRWAMVIGVSAYSDDLGRLKYTAKEAREFAGLLTGELQFDPANVKVLADGGKPEEAPTSARILSSLDDLLSDKRLDKGNLFVFYFSGHGVGTSKGDYLLPADTTKDRIEEMGVPVREVVSRIVEAGLKNVLFIADACRAGEKNDFGVDFTALCRDANLAVILGCQPGRRSYEYPSLKRGAFTHFLLKALVDPATRDQSGAVWASNIGETVRKQVFDFTEPDHGKFAQSPVVWGDGSTLDVLLAAYPPTELSEDSLGKFLAKAGRLTKQDYAAAATSFALALQDQGKHEKSIDMLKVVDQLGELTPSGRFALATSLDTLGRFGEAAKAYGDFFAMPDGFWKDLAQTTASTRLIDPKVRVQSASRLLTSSPDWDVRLLSWRKIDVHGTYLERLKWVKQFSRPGDTERQKLYASSQVASVESRWRDALNSVSLARKAPGDSPQEIVLYSAELRPLLALGDEKMLDLYLARGERVGGGPAISFIQRAQLAKNRSQLSARLEYLKRALASGLPPESLILAVKVAGPYIGSLQKEFLDVAVKYPYVWQARMTVAFIKQIQGDPSSIGEILGAVKYLDDELAFYSTLYDMQESFFAEAVEIGTLKQAEYDRQTNFFFLQLIGYAPKFGFQEKLWEQFLHLGFVSERLAQLEVIAQKALPYNPTLIPRELRPQMLLLAMNRGNDPLVQSLFKSSFDPAEGDDPSWIMACYQASRGRAKEAAKLVSTLRPPSKELKERMDAMKAYLQVATQGVSSSQVKIPTSKDPVVQAFAGLSWAARGDWKRAEPLLASQDRVFLGQYIYLHEFALSKLEAHYRSTGRIGLAQQLAFSAMQRQPGNPMYAHYSFADKPGLAQFAGAAQMKGLLIDDRLFLQSMNTRGTGSAVSGSLAFNVDSNGLLKGSFTDDEGTKCTFEGRVDKLGNVRGSGTWQGETLRLVAKLPPPKLYKTLAAFKTEPQAFDMTTESGYRIWVLGYPSGIKLPESELKK